MKVNEKARTPTEGEWFVVNLNTINRNLFKREKKDPEQEKTRQIIREAFEEVRKHPRKYHKEFKAMILAKTWEKKSVRGIEAIASEVGDHAADRVEYALVLAQRISNGESWRKVCNEPDDANWYRLIEWTENYWRMVGGSKIANDEKPSSFIYHYNYSGAMHIQNATMLAISYEE